MVQRGKQTDARGKLHARYGMPAHMSMVHTHKVNQHGSAATYDALFFRNTLR